MGLLSLAGGIAGGYFGGPAGSAIGAGIGSALDGSGDATQSTNQATSRTPWGPAAPWLLANVNRGQDLQKLYQANPFSTAQKQAYGNQFALSNSYRANMPAIMQAMSNQGTFNRMNPTASRPQMFQFQAPSNLGFTADPFASLPADSAIQAMKGNTQIASGTQMTPWEQLLANWRTGN